MSKDDVAAALDEIGTLLALKGENDFKCRAYHAGSRTISQLQDDIGQLVALSHLKGAPFGAANEAGFVRAYEAASGRSLREMEYFRAFWLFQLGVIHEGWVAFNGSSPWYSRADLDPLLARSIEEIR